MQRRGGLPRLIAYAAEMGVERLLWLIELVEVKYGHHRSVQVGAGVDGDDNPLPWFTYPAIEFLRQLDLRTYSIFEYGAGYSSMYFGPRALRVTSVESDRRWISTIEQKLAPNNTVLWREERDRYIHAVTESGETYDIIIVDGLYRMECAAAALPYISERGFLILDNADWHPETTRLLRESGLIQIDFCGMTPNNLYTASTSFFLKPSVAFSTLSGRQPDAPIGAHLPASDPQ